jgi:hypothetical protein
MAVNFLQEIYKPAHDWFSRTVIVTPVKSQPGVASYTSRGIFDTNETDVVGLDGQIYSDAVTELDILIDEYPILPQQGDIVFIPKEADVDGGTFEIEDLGGVGNAGGELTLTLKRITEFNLVILTSRYILGSPTFGFPILFTVDAVCLANSYDLSSLDFATPTLSVS